MIIVAIFLLFACLGAGAIWLDVQYVKLVKRVSDLEIALVLEDKLSDKKVS